MRAVFSAAARRDLDVIWNYIARDSLDAAQRWIQTIQTQVNLLAASPAIGHSRRDLTDRDLLFLPSGSYLIIYSIEPGRVRVLAVIHGARDVASLLLSRGA